LRSPSITVASVFPGYDRCMPWWAAAALAFFAAVFLVAALVAAVLATKTFREVARTRAAVTGALADLTAALDRLERRLGGAAERGAEIERRIDALNASLGKLSALKEALGDAGRTYRRFRSAVPRK